MSVQVEKLEKSTAKLTIEVPAEEFEAAIQKTYLEQRGRINVPGFRKGKAPRKMIEKMYGVGVFYEGAVDKVLPGAYSKAAEESGLDIVARPEIDVVQVEAGKPVIFTATVAVKPEVTLGQYKGLEVTKTNVEVTEEDIAAELKKEQEKNSRTINVDDRPVADGDSIKLDFEGFVDGEAFEGGKGENFDLVIGSGSFIPGFEEQLIGANIGDDVEVNVTFPEHYQSESLAGKPAVFKCKVNAISVKELPELDDEFAQEASEFDTLEEYKADIAKNLADEKAEAAATAKENAVVSAAVANAQMEIADAMIEAQAEQIVDGYARRLQSQGLSMDQYLQYTGTTKEMLQEQVKPEALKQIQTRLVLEKIAEVENIEVSEEKVNEQLQQMADQYKMELDKLKSVLGDYQLDQMKQDLAVQEAVTLITEAAVEVEKAEEAPAEEE